MNECREGLFDKKANYYKMQHKDLEKLARGSKDRDKDRDLEPEGGEMLSHCAPSNKEMGSHLVF